MQTQGPVLKNRKTFSAKNQINDLSDKFCATLDEKVDNVLQARREKKAESTSLFNADNWNDFDCGFPSPD